MNAFTDTRRVQAKAGRNLGNHTSQAERMKAGYMLPIVSNFIGLLNGVIEASTCLIMVDKISKLFRRFLEERRKRVGGSTTFYLKLEKLPIFFRTQIFQLLSWGGFIDA